MRGDPISENETLRHRGVVVGAISLGVVATILRLMALDLLPGINGDEAFYGLMLHRTLH